MCKMCGKMMKMLVNFHRNCLNISCEKEMFTVLQDCWHIHLLRLGPCSVCFNLNFRYFSISLKFTMNATHISKNKFKLLLSANQLPIAD